MAGSLAAKEIQVPLNFDSELLRQVLVAKLYTAAKERAPLWEDGSGCGFLTLWEPQVSVSGDRIRIVSAGEGQAGTPFGDQCLAPLQWKGFLEVFEVPVLSADRQTLDFRVVESNLLDGNHRKGLLTGKLWDIVKGAVQPRFESVRVDLHQALGELRDLLPLVVANDDAARIEAMLGSLRLESAKVVEKGVSVTLNLTISPRSTPVVPVAEPTLTTAELAQWEAAWQRWDGFLTFVVKIFGKDIPAKEIQFALRDVLLEARYDILDALAPRPGVKDPTRELFLESWERLAPVVRAGVTSLPGANGLRYLSFVAAGDALTALDQAGSDIGLDISADGLRRLARMVAPYTTEDPLSYGDDVDPELRQLFGFGAPLPAPDFSDMPVEDDAEPLPTQSWLRRWFGPTLAYAGIEAPPPAAWQRWIADPESLDAYLPSVRQVLLEVTKQVLDGGSLDPKYHEVYRRLVLTTAWQESCWRQFIRRPGGRVTFMASAVGATGMMQVFEKVWRGMYDIKGLRWDIRYNARAGADILLHYISDYAIAKKEDELPGGLDNLARSTYGMYNGGPGHRARYRQKNTKSDLRKIDDLFYEKYRAVSAGRELDVRGCYGAN